MDRPQVADAEVLIEQEETDHVNKDDCVCNASEEQYNDQARPPGKPRIGPYDTLPRLARNAASADEPNGTSARAGRRSPAPTIMFLMRRLLLGLIVLVAACGDSKIPYEVGLSKRLGFVEFGSSQAVGFCSVATAGDSHTGTVNFLTPSAPDEVRDDLVRAGGTVASTSKDRAVITVGEDTYTVMDRKPTSVEVRFAERTQITTCPTSER